MACQCRAIGRWQTKTIETAIFVCRACLRAEAERENNEQMVEVKHAKEGESLQSSDVRRAQPLHQPESCGFEGNLNVGVAKIWSSCSEFDG